jgi:hypothetical protein
MTCVSFREGRLNGPCHRCGAWTQGGPVHVIGDLFYHPACCPEHGPDTRDWDHSAGEMPLTGGVQEALF